MISDEMLPELEHFRRFETELPIVSRPELEDLVVYGENDSKPVHNWFRFKEGYSADLLAHLLVMQRDLESEIRLLDPYCGSGTTLLSAQTFGSPRVDAVGLERNPLLHFVSKTKLSWPIIDPGRLLNISEQVLRNSKNRTPELPALSSINTGRCISKHIAQRLLAVKDAIRDVDQPYGDVLLLGLASCIEGLSKVRKDGRALRFVERPSRHVEPTLRKRWCQMAADIRFLQSGGACASQPKVHLGDGREPLSVVPTSSVDLIVTSPPYPNNIDYSEVYKLELWLLGFVKTGEDFLELRRSTFRSHQTSNLRAEDPDFENLITTGALSRFFLPVIERTASMDERWRKKLVIGYFADIWKSLKQQYQCLRAGGRSFLVVGNSLHGSVEMAFLIPTDILCAVIGMAIGFEVENISIARNMKRRLLGNHFLRESIVCFHKP